MFPNSGKLRGTRSGSIVHLDKHALTHWSGYLLLVIYGGSQIASTWTCEIWCRK